MPEQLLAVNGRLRVRDGMVLTVSGAECDCCDDTTDPCDSGCGYSYHANFTPALDNCGNCAPGTLSVEITLAGGPTLNHCYSGSSTGAFSGNFDTLIEKAPPAGTKITACLTRGGISDRGAGGISVGYSVQGVKIPKFRWRTYSTRFNCAGPFTIHEIDRANISVSVAFNNPNPSYIQITAATCDGSFILFQSRITIVDLLLYDVSFTDFCSGVTVPGMSEAEWIALFDRFGQSHNVPYYIDGSATVKPCCVPSDTKPCDGAQPKRWYRARKCSDNSLIDVWFSQDQVQAGKAYYIYPFGCVHVQESDGQDYNAGQTPPADQILYYIWASYDSCGDCGGSLLEVVDCDGGVVGYVPSGDIDDSTKTRVLGGICVSFSPLLGDANPDLPTFSGDDFGTESDDCDSCTPPDCASDNDAPRDHAIAIVFDWPYHCGSNDTIPVPNAITLFPQGDGTWAYSEIGLCADTNDTATIVCSGKYWVLTIDFCTAGYSLCTSLQATWHKLRTGPTPNEGAGEWDLINQSVNISLCCGQGGTDPEEPPRAFSA